MSKPNKNIYLIKSNKLILVYKEAKHPDLNQVNAYFDYLEELVAEKKFHLILDLSDCKHPSAEVRHALKNRYKAIEHLVNSYSIYIGNNILLRIAMKFIGASLGLKKIKTYNSIQEAIEQVQNL
jgi:hypothetical protein